MLKERIYVILGDEKGHVKIWDLTGIKEHYGLEPAPCFRDTKLSFNPKRKENIDVSNVAMSFLKL